MIEDTNLVTLFILFVCLSMFFLLVHKYLLNILQKLSGKSKNKIDDVFILVLSSFSTYFYILTAFIIAITQTTQVPSNIENILFSFIVFWVAYRFSSVSNKVIELLFCKDNNSAKQLLGFFSTFTKIILWILVLIIILSINGVNVTTLLASLGIGGLAVAFASQKILSDLFSAFVIFFDKPFGIGDYIIVDQKDGVVEHIGIKTTRIRSLSGELIIIPNEEMTSTVIQNYKSVKERRAVINIGVLYETPQDKLKKITTIMEDVVEKDSKCRIDRAALKEFSQSSVDYELVFYAKVSSYKEFLKTNEKILFDIFEKFKENSIEFAYPTQTLHIKK